MAMHSDGVWGPWAEVEVDMSGCDLPHSSGGKDGRRWDMLPSLPPTHSTTLCLCVKSGYLRSGSFS